MPVIEMLYFFVNDDDDDMLVISLSAIVGVVDIERKRECNTLLL